MCVFSFLDLVRYLHCFHLFFLSFLIFSLCTTGFSYINTEHHCLLTVDVIGYRTFLWQLYLGLRDFTLGMDDSPDVWKMVHYFFCALSLLYEFVFPPRSWELCGCFSCGNVIKTAFLCVPDYCSLHLLGRKIKWWRTISDSMSLVCFEQLDRRDGEVQSRCSCNFVFYIDKDFFSGWYVKYDKATYCPNLWFYFFLRNSDLRQCR